MSYPMMVIPDVCGHAGSILPFLGHCINSSCKSRFKYVEFSHMFSRHVWILQIPSHVWIYDEILILDDGLNTNLVI